MKAIYVTDKLSLWKFAAEVEATHILSLLDDGDKPFLPHGFNRDNAKLVNMLDVEGRWDYGAPKFEQFVDIMNWSANLPEDAILVVHCYAGVSRSTATALGIMVQKYGLDKIDWCASKLLEIRDIASPNMLIAEYIDTILNANGKLYIASHGLNLHQENKKLAKLKEKLGEI